MSGAVAAAMVARARRRVADYFITGGATRADAAIAYTPSPRRLERRMFERMLAFGAVKRTETGHYWLDERKFADFKKESLAKVLGILALAGFAAAGAIAAS